MTQKVMIFSNLDSLFPRSLYRESEMYSISRVVNDKHKHPGPG